jgi:excisionase family DNA binding protein
MVAPDQEVLTINEVAELLRFDPRSVRRMIHSGSLPAVRVGGRWRIYRDELNSSLGRPAEGWKRSR